MKKRSLGILLRSSAPFALAALALLLPEAAQAQQLKDTVAAVQAGIAQVPALISGFAYIMGSGMMIAGAMKLRAHAENPLQEPLQKGLVRLAIGAAIAGLPALAQWANVSLSIGNDTVDYKPLPNVSAPQGR